MPPLFLLLEPSPAVPRTLFSPAPRSGPRGHVAVAVAVTGVAPSSAVLPVRPVFPRQEQEALGRGCRAAHIWCFPRCRCLRFWPAEPRRAGATSDTSGWAGAPGGPCPASIRLGACAPASPPVNKQPRRVELEGRRLLGLSLGRASGQLGPRPSTGCAPPLGSVPAASLDSGPHPPHSTCTPSTPPQPGL